MRLRYRILLGLLLLQINATRFEAQTTSHGEAVYDRTADQEAIQRQIVTLEKRLWDGDEADASTLVADDAEAVKHAHRYTRADEKAAAKDLKTETYSMDDIHVRMLRHSVALLTYRINQEASFRGTKLPSPVYFASLWVDRGSKWKNVFYAESAPDVVTDQYLPRAGLESSPSPSSPQNRDRGSVSDPRAELLAIETQLLCAYVNKNLSVRDRFVADDFLGVNPDGTTYTKAQDLQELRDGAFVMKSFNLKDTEVRVLGETVLVTGRNTATTIYKGKEVTETIRYADTFVRRDGSWQMVYSQDTNITPDLTPD